MKGWAARLADIGTVVRLDYPYMLAGKRAPDRLPVLVEAHRKALEEARQGHSGPVVLAGKSMGGRIGCHVSLEETVSGLVCFGYPLKGASKRAGLRDEVLRALTAPVLFVQGTRDPLCPLDLLTETRPTMKAPNELFVVEDGNHSLEVPVTRLRARGETQEDVDAGILEAIRGFVAGLG